MTLETLLPEKLSDTLKLALKELKACEKDPKVRIDMSYWYGSRSSGCSVCLAGAVMRNRLDFPVDSNPDLGPSTYNARRLYALDRLRRGGLHWALGLVGRDLPPTLPAGIEVAGYAARKGPQRTAFYRSMNALVRLLRKAGE